jgi:hypothetical protein
VQQLPQLALRPVDARIAESVDFLQQEVRRADLEPPWPFEDLAFYPFGIPGYHYRSSIFDENCQRVMVISPFLSDQLLQDMTEQGGGHVLVSRADSIAALSPETLACFEAIYVLDEAGTAEADPDAAENAGEETAGVIPEPSGLHAKLFVTESGWDATWLIGSANATDAAFGNKNVEFMVKLRGRKSKAGINKVLGGEDEEDALLALLCPYRPAEQVALDEGRKRAETLADDVRNWLVALGMRLKVVQQAPDRFDMVLHHGHSDQDVPQGRYTVTCWPVTLRPEQHRVAFESRSSRAALAFPNLSMLALTPFIAFEITAEVNRHRHALRFVLSLPISGVPESRIDHLYSAIISDRTQFIRYLLMMLGGEEGDPFQWADWIGEKSGCAWKAGANGAEVPLLEALVRALSRSPETIDRIAELVERLQRTTQGQQVLPEEFGTLWEAIIQARSETL